MTTSPVSASYMASKYPEAYVHLSDGTALLKEPESIDGGTYMVNFREDGLAEVNDVEGNPFCVASASVAVALCLLINERDRNPDGCFPADDCWRIVDRMKANSDSVP